jgi:hypothetical protein
MEKYNTCSHDRYWPVLAGIGRYWPVFGRYLAGIDRRWPVLTDILPGTGLELFYTGLGADTRHSGRYRNGIHNYAWHLIVFGLELTLETVHAHVT